MEQRIHDLENAQASLEAQVDEAPNINHFFRGSHFDLSRKKDSPIWSSLAFFLSGDHGYNVIARGREELLCCCSVKYLWGSP